LHVAHLPSMLPSPQKRLLRKVLGHVMIARQSQRKPVDALGELFNQLVHAIARPSPSGKSPPT
jgi:hypothetical protein